MNGDVTVLGLQPNTCVLEDIAMDVPHGISVVIPAERAMRSKDLWRCVSQRLLFRLDTGSSLSQRIAPHPLTAEVEELRSRCRTLEEENQVLRGTITQLQSAQQGKLDTILGLLRNPVTGTPIASPNAVLSPSTAPVQAPSQVVQMEAPPFVPSKIRPDDVDAARVELEKGSSEGGVSETASLLRSVRQRSGQ